jgi:hypothetical protein
MPAAYIPDGYTFRFRIESPFCDPVEAAGRPILHEPRQAIQRMLGKADTASAITGAVVSTVAEYLVEWDITTPKGEAVAITPDNLRRIHPDILEQLFSTLLGTVAPAKFLDTSHEDQTTAEEFQKAIGNNPPDNAGN